MQRFLLRLLTTFIASLCTISGYAMPVAFDGQTPGTAGLSALQILNDGHSIGDGLYWIDPDGAGGEAPFQVYADMTTQGGGWTLGLKTWYQAGHHGNAGAVGSVIDALALKGNAYKLADSSINALIGPSNSFDILATQTGFNPFYSTGNNEYVIVNDYVGQWTWQTAMSASLTPTVMESFSTLTGAQLWQGEFLFGAGGYGLNSHTVAAGSINPGGGSGCTPGVGTHSSSSWHHFYMGASNSDSYMYVCNGAQHSSSVNMNHLYWFRSNEFQTAGGGPVSVSASSTVGLLGIGLLGLGLLRRRTA